LEVVKTFAKHISLPKVGFIEYVKPMTYPAHVKVPEVSHVLAIKAAETNDFVETPPFPNKVLENLLTYISNKSAKRKCTPYEQIEMKPEVSIIKELNKENPSISVIPYTVYLEIKANIDPIEMEETGMTIQLPNKEYISPLGIVRDVGGTSWKD
jgi:hypothetical protein